MKLQTKLIAAFIVIILFMGISQSLFLQSSIRSTFQNYLDQHTNNFMLRMEQTLEAYYHESGSWDNVQELFFDTDSRTGQGHGMMMRRMIENMSLSSDDLLLLDMNGEVIGDSSGTRIGTNGNDLTGKQITLKVNNAKIGILVLHQRQLQNLEKEFIQSSNGAILISGLFAAMVALLSSLFIARKISKPLNRLMTSIKRIGDGQKVSEINISTSGEFYELSEAFNDMIRKLDRNEEIRRSLVADVAHELRTPLAILQGKLESIQEGVISPSEEIVLELTDEVYRLSRLVKDLQQLSLAEAGKLKLNLVPVNLHELIDKVCHHFLWLAEEKGITLRHNKIPNDISLLVDADRMTQVFVNLIGNALRHTPSHGKVEVSGQQQGASLFIQVADTGQGIPDEVLPHVFDRFYKGDSSRSRSESGTGLGLSIAKGFIEAHGGAITVESQVGSGTVFTIILPCKIMES
jgi:two-component system, OmpR family, sensor histidine kinase BaeS